MLGARNRLHVLRIIALQAANEGDAELGGEERVFTVGFLPTAPARVAEDVDIRRIEIEPDVLATVAVVGGDVVVVLGAAFGGDGVGLLVDQRKVPVVNIMRRDF